ncbi:protein FAR1-RELATED SEQUENCE 5-like [Silene latifolia]|uniref:protein FAR1-RELATED SEQUENCE 5-like n=1 Tax=Silene latifolia TaxID=37657 RepID=UPI003D770A62
MEGAIKKVFPETKHRLCLWHILQNADKNLKDHPQFPQIDRDLRTLVHESITEEELQDMWDDFMEKYNLRRNKWLRGAWDMRQRWMPVFWKDTFCAGMSSTQRSEQTNRFIKTYMSIETARCNSWSKDEDAIEKKVEDEKVNNAKDIKSPLKWDPMILFEDIFSKVYTNKKFGEVKTEMFEFRGILCRHIMKCLDVLDVKAIPDKYIIERWRKDLVRGYENIRVGYYNPDESERVKRSLEITVKNDYIKRLAMQSEGSSAIYNSRTDELIKELEAHAGIQSIDSFAAGGVSSKMWGRRRLRPRETIINTPQQEGDIRDPPTSEEWRKTYCQTDKEKEKDK